MSGSRAVTTTTTSSSGEGHSAATRTAGWSARRASSAGRSLPAGTGSRCIAAVVTKGAGSGFTVRERPDERAVRARRSAGGQRHQMGVDQVAAEAGPDLQDDGALGFVAQIDVEAAGLDAHGAYRALGTRAA